MGLPTTTPVTAEVAFQRVLATASSVLSNLRGVQGLLDGGGPLSMDNLVGLYQSLSYAREAGEEIQNVEGLVEYARDRLGANYDINAEFAKSVLACKSVTDKLLELMPSDGSGGYVAWKLVDGKLDRVQLDPSSFASLSPLVASAVATFA